jgi:2-polyprenyl-3-methyl-5-hydroxy-6-metoxy-1,4-benzoquinol methylase
MAASSPGEHWDEVYTTRPSTAVSWHQEQPTVSLRLVQRAASPDAALIDVGAGTSSLAEALITTGWADVTVLDVSEAAISALRKRLGEQVHYIAADVVSWLPERTYDVWHDRAVFHFLTEDGEQARYVETATAAVRRGGSLVLATFAADGPTTCSGLPTSRYDADELAARFAPAFRLSHAEREEHVTPGGVIQPFTWVVLRRV